MTKDNSVKSHVLRFLEERQGECISGARIAGELAVSRAAVWKAIEELRGEGYAISAATKKGYSLDPGSDLLSPQGIAAHLRHKEFAPLIHTYDTLESTNLTAKQLAVAGAPHGTLTAAATQTAGRGRLGRSFYSPRNLGIYFSVIFRPESMVSDPTQIVNPVLMTTAASVAAARAIEKVCGREVQIKWVNDLYLDGKKVCGILTEGVSNFETGTIESIVIGIGINCFSPDGGYPEELEEKAASLSGGQLSSFTKNALIAAVADELLEIQSELQGSHFIEEYKRRSLVLGKEILFYSRGNAAFSENPETAVSATAIDIDDQGGLVVRLVDGTVRTLSTGEISVRTREA